MLLSMTHILPVSYTHLDVYKRQAAMLLLAAQMVIHLALQFLVDGLSQLADIAVRLPTHSGKPGGAVQPQREKIRCV